MQLQEVGEIMHLANSGRVIIKLSIEIKEGQLLCNESNQKIAKVTELIGPVRNPYASAIPLTNNLKKITGMKVFLFEQTSPAKRKNRRKHR
jgi:RNA-binding protein|tara:strand:- start:739 stop:1011 length:273 start_codon:yes stop_codon:yes gene_type:complete